MKDAFDKIIDDYSGKLYAYLVRLLSSKDDAEDILQNVFTSFWAKMPTINPDNYSSYLYRMAHNKAINHLKKENKYTAYNEFKHTPTETDKDDLIEALKKEKISRGLRSLKPKESFAIELQYYQKKSYKEIARIMETTPNAVDSLLFRAKKKLRKFLQD